MPSISSSSWNFSGAHLRVTGARLPSREIDDGEDLASHLEAEVFAPLDLLGRVGEGEAEFADPFDVGHGEMIARRTLLSEAGKFTRAGRPRHTQNELHLLSCFAQHHRHFQLFLAAEDGHFHGVAGAVLVHDLGEGLLAFDFFSVDGDD